MTRRLLLLRHGRTAWNAEERAQGHADPELDAVGHSQAAAVARRLSAVAIATLWSSDLTRAVQTAGYVGQGRGLAVRVDSRLRELDVGARQGLTLDEFARKFPAEHAAWARGKLDPAVPGAETAEAAAARMVPALRECIDSLAPGETGLVVTHGTALKVALSRLLGWPHRHATSLRGLGNCRWATVEVTPAGPGAGRVRMSAYNQDSPLG